MTLTIEATDQITHVDGTRVRVWNGKTAAGIPCLVFVSRIAVPQDQDSTEFDRELQEQLPPGRQIPLSQII